MKKILFSIIILLTLTGCGDQTLNTEDLQFTKVGANYQLISSDQTTALNNLYENLDNLNIDLSPDTKVAVLATSTANILDAIGVNIVAVTSSDKLNENLRSKLDSGEITNLGNPLEPNLEQLYSVNADITIVGSNFPHQEKYQDLDNLVVVPQDTYADIFYTTYGIIDKLDLAANDVFNELVTTDQQAKALVTPTDLGKVAMLKYAYGNVTIAPDDTYAGSLLTELGVENMYGDLNDINIPMDREKLLADNPDVIILYTKGDELQEQLEAVKNDQSLQNLKAYQNKQIFILESESLNADIDSPNTLLTLSENLYGN